MLQNALLKHSAILLTGIEQKSALTINFWPFEGLLRAGFTVLVKRILCSSKGHCLYFEGRYGWMTLKVKSPIQ